MRIKVRKSHKDTSPPKLLGTLIFFSLSGALLLALMLLRAAAFKNPSLADAYTRSVFRPLAAVWTRFQGLLPFSLTEFLLILGSPALLILLILALIRLIRRPHYRLRRLLKKSLSLLAIAGLLLSLFLVFHGINYARSPLAQDLSLSVRQRPVHELEEAVRLLAKAASQTREEVDESEEGLADPGSLAHMWETAYVGWDLAAVRWPALASSVRARPKGVLLSHYWSYTNIVGLYMPLLVEPNVNIDQPAFMIPMTAAHEIAHAQGFAREGDADFAALLSCLSHPDPAWRYSGLMGAWKSAGNRLLQEDPDLWRQIWQEELSPAVKRDLAAESAYWEAFQTPVADLSDKVNDTYLKANKEEEGVKSYGQVVDLLLAFLEDPGAADLFFSNPPADQAG